VTIRAKLVLAIVAGMAVLAAATIAITGAAAQRNVGLVAEAAVVSASAAFAAQEAGDIEKLHAGLHAIAANPAVVEAFAARDRERLLAASRELFEHLREHHDVTHWYYHLPDRTVLLRVHAPALHGDAVDRATLRKAIETDHSGSGKELGKTAFALRTVVPVRRGQELVGYLELGEEIDHFLGGMRRQTGDAYALLVRKERLDRLAWSEMRARTAKPDTWDARTDLVVVDATGPDVAALAAGAAFASLPEGGGKLGPIEHGERTVVRGAVPVTDAAGERVGWLFVAHDITELFRNISDTRLRVMAALLGVSVVLTLALLWLADQLVFRRLHRMIETMEDLQARLAGGDYDVALPEPEGKQDELGRFEAFFGRFLTVVAGLLRELTGRRTG
jgi:HAMP domain-containing protein